MAEPAVPAIAPPPAGGAGAQPGDTDAQRPRARAVARRADSVAAGLAELDRWLLDQVRTGLSGLTHAGYEPWDTVAARLVDAKAPAVAAAVRRLAGLVGAPDQLLTELGLLHLLAVAFRQIDDLPGDLADTVRMRIGFPMTSARVLADQPPVSDGWHVLGVREEPEDKLLVRRLWLRGERTGRPALLLSYAGPGQAYSGPGHALGAGMSPGTRIEADLCFYPGAQPLRAVVAQVAGASEPGLPPRGDAIAEALRGYAAALARDPWLDRWPMLLSAVVPAASHLVETDGTALALDPTTADPWRLVGAAGGRPVPVFGEWSAAGFRPLTVWPEGRLVRL